MADKVPPDVPPDPKPTDEFLVTALGIEDGVRMENWSIEGSVEYNGRQVMMIVGDQYLENLTRAGLKYVQISSAQPGPPKTR